MPIPRTNDERDIYGLDSSVQPPKPTDEDLKLAWDTARREREFRNWLLSWLRAPTAADWEAWQRERP